MSFLEELETLDPRSNRYTPMLEIPTPHKISVLLLVQQFINVKRAASEGGLEYKTDPRRNFAMLVLKLMQYPDMSYKDLYNLITSHKYKVDVVHLQAFKNSMSDLFGGGLENIFDFSEVRNVDRMMNSETVGIGQNSTVGLYVRRVGVVLERLNFPEVMSLYQNVCLYYDKGIRALALAPTKMNTSTESIEERPKEDTKSSDDSDVPMEEDPEDDSKLFNVTGDPACDTDPLLQERSIHSKWSPYQADLFVKQQSTLLEYNEIRAMSPTHLEKKVNTIIKDNPLNSNAYFILYMNSLRLCDYFRSVDALHRSFDRSPSHLMLCSENKGFQFFCLNLAVMHATFNHLEEALNVLKECVMIAQECGDRRCLDLANSWYCFLNNNKIDPFEKSLPDDQDQNSLALAIQFVVKFGAQCCYQPQDLFELLHKADEISRKNNKKENVFDSVAMRAALWCLYGKNNISSLFAQRLLQRTKSTPLGNISNCESILKVISAQITWYHYQFDHQLSAVLLDHARRCFPRYPISNDWVITDLILSIQQAIYRCSWEEALTLCSQVMVIDEFVGKFQLASVCIARRFFHSARILIEYLMKTPYIDLLSHIRCVQLLAYCSINEKTYNTNTVDSLLNAITITVEAHMDYEHAILDMIFAEILIRTDLTDKALILIRGAIHKIYNNGSVYEKSKADFALVRCLMVAAKTVEAKKRCFLRGLCHLERALTNFKALEAHPRVCDILIFMSKSYNEFGLIKERNKYACQFKQYISEHPTSAEYFNMIF